MSRDSEFNANEQMASRYDTLHGGFKYVAPRRKSYALHYVVLGLSSIGAFAGGAYGAYLGDKSLMVTLMLPGMLGIVATMIAAHISGEQ